ncbi:hypothetical protein F4805DRAFT_85840 [Annulohypoxylon moriforme]|nr:hypothetical protein F4805DRAFT_85840 [Annulohypoxylon moriforme]
MDGIVERNHIRRTSILDQFNRDTVSLASKSDDSNGSTQTSHNNHWRNIMLGDISRVTKLDALKSTIIHERSLEDSREASDQYPSPFDRTRVDESPVAAQPTFDDIVCNDYNLTSWALQRLRSQPLRFLCTIMLDYSSMKWHLALRPEVINSKIRRGLLRFNYSYTAQAIYGSIAGYVVKRRKWCTNCNKGNGPFNCCIIAPGHLGGACNNCFYTGKAESCSLFRVLKDVSEQDRTALKEMLNIPTHAEFRRPCRNNTEVLLTEIYNQISQLVSTYNWDEDREVLLIHERRMVDCDRETLGSVQERTVVEPESISYLVSKVRRDQDILRSILESIRLILSRGIEQGKQEDDSTQVG